MRKMIVALILFSSVSDLQAVTTNFNSITISGDSNSLTPTSGVRVWIRSGGSSGAIVGTASDVAIIPDAGGFFSTQTYIGDPGPWIFQAGSDYVVQLTSSTDEIISTFSITAVPFALTVRGDAQPGNQNIFGAYGNVGIGTTTPSYRLHITSAAGTGGDMLVVSTGASNVIRMTGAGGIYANKFYGDGSSLAGVTGAGDNFGNHTATQSLNMAGYNILNVSTIVVQGDSIVISPNSQGNYDHSISIGPDTVNNSGYGIGIGNNASSNGTQGIGLGRDAVGNSNGGVGIGMGSSYNYTLGVGIGTYASNNQIQGVGIGFSASGNNTYGTGIGSDARGNSNYGVGVGYGAYNNAWYAVGIGAGSHDNGGYATSVGANTLSLSSSVALGSDAKATNSESVAIGAGARATAVHSVALGAYTVNNTTSSVKIREGYLLLVDSITTNGLIVANKFSGDGSGLTGVTASGAVQKIGDTMTGQLTLAGSTLTVTGNAFSVGESTLVVAAGIVGVGVNPAGNAPGVKLIIQPTSNNEYPALGAPGGTLRMLSANGLYGLQAGVSSGGYTWMQAGRKDGSATAYNLFLQPAGGTVSVGTINNDQRLTVGGGIGLTGQVISSGTGNNYFAGTVGLGTTAPGAKLDVNGSISAANNIWSSGTVTASLFNGSGASLSALNASSLASGTVSDSRLSSNVGLLASSQTFTGQPVFANGFKADDATGQTFLNHYSTAAVSLVLTGMMDNPSYTASLVRVGNAVTMTVPGIGMHTKNGSSGALSLPGIPAEYRPTSLIVFAQRASLSGGVQMTYFEIDTSGVLSMYGSLAGANISASQSNCGWGSDITFSWVIK